MNKTVVRFIVPVLAGVLVCMVFTGVVTNRSNRNVNDLNIIDNEQLTVFEPAVNDMAGEDPAVPPVPAAGAAADEFDPAGSRGGDLQWVFTAERGGAVSTPALLDLDADGYLEVVFVTTGDEIIALNHDGSKRWVNSNYVIETASYFKSEMNLDFWPIDLFSSITPANIDRDPRPEIILGAYNGLVFLNHDGEPKYSQAHTGRYYFSTPVVVDLEGDYANIDIDGSPISHFKDLEILTGADDTTPNAYLEAWHATGGDVFNFKVVEHGESAFVLGIAVGDLDGSMEDGIYENGEEAWMEIAFATHDKGLRIYEQINTEYSSTHDHNHPYYDEDTRFTIKGHLSYATPAIGNFSKQINPGTPEQLEIITGKGGWHGITEPYLPITRDAGLFCYDQDGNEAWRSMDEIIVVSSPAVADVQTRDRHEDTRHLAEFEVFAANSHEGEIYSVDADDGTVLWSWEIDGAKSEVNRIISSPAIMNINADDELEVVVGSDNGKVYAFDGDPSDGSNDGVEFSEYSGEGTDKFDLLWVFDTHEHGGTGKIGISSPVVADIDKDGTLEVIIGDSEGNVWCIDAGGSSSTGQVDWPMFHYDLNNSGFYDPNVKFAVDISTPQPHDGIPEPIGTLKYVEPGETVSFPLKITNKGIGLSKNSVDNIFVNTYYVTELPGWKYELEGGSLLEFDGMRYVKLPMQESTLIYVNVTAPKEGELGDYVIVRLTVNSSNDHNALDRIELQAILKLRIDFNLEFSWMTVTDPLSPYFEKKVDEIMPGEQRIYTVSVQNIGNINDSYCVSVADYDRSWDVQFIDGDGDDPLSRIVDLDSPNFKYMGAENSTKLQLSVSVPVDAIGSELSILEIRGVSLYSEREQDKDHPLTNLIERKDFMLINIGDVPQLLLTCDDNEKNIMPGGSARYTVTVQNNGNVDYSVGLAYSEPAAGWSVKMPAVVDVRSQSSKTVHVMLGAPTEEIEVKAGIKEMLTIEGTVETNNGLLSSSIGIIGTMGQVYHINATITPEVNTTKPGRSVNYFVTIENLGNGDDELELSPLTLELGWGMQFPDGDKIYLEWRDTLIVPVKMQIPPDTMAGSFLNILNISNGIGPGNFVNILTNVLQSHDISVGVYNENNDMYMSETTRYMSPESTTIFDLKITNNGNGDDTADITLYLLKYTKPAPGGGLMDVTRTAEESDLMLEDAVVSGGVTWRFTSVLSSSGSFAAEPVYWNFDEVIPVDRTAEILYQPDDNIYSTNHARLKLAPYQSAWVQVIVEYPAGGIMDIMEFTVTASSAGTDIEPLNNDARLNIEIKYADMAFDEDFGEKGVKISDKLTSEKPHVTVNVKIRNIGAIEARDIDCAFYIDGQFLDSRTVMRLVNSSHGNYQDILISFTWKAQPGEHKLEFRLDPDNSIIESNEQNNIVSKNIEVKESIMDFLGEGTKATCAIILIIIAAVIVTITGMNVLKKRKDD